MTKSVAVSRTDTPSSPAIWQSMRREMDKLFDQAFQRSFALPIDVDRNAVTAQIAKGVLTVTMPKTAESRDVRKIDVKAA